MPEYSPGGSPNPLLSPDQGNGADIHPRTLLIGYGNIDRQDDGVAWHILNLVLEKSGYTAIDPFEQPRVECTTNLTVLYALQLTPELAEMISAFDRVCFIDAHTGAVPEPLNIQTIAPEFTSSPFTHHLTPAACLYMVNKLYGKNPQAMLVSVLGNEFGFSQSLSAQTSALAEQAAEFIHRWMNG